VPASTRATRTASMVGDGVFSVMSHEERSISPKIRSSHADLLAEIDSALEHAGDDNRCARRHEPVSGWSVQQQLEHVLLVDRTILTWLHAVAKGTMGTDGPGTPTFPGRLVMRTGFIPRGRGRAPDYTLPEGMDLPAIHSGLIEMKGEAEALADALDTLATDRTTRRHPMLGHYTPAQWLRFAHVHHRHHDRIIRDILKATR
jgi:hypothetical protein